jgi:pimeloyl-ACP methyl ester carboxylesterase
LPTETQKGFKNRPRTQEETKCGLHNLWPQNAGIAEHWAPIAGSRMRYLKSGTGRPLILVHGLLGYSFSWRFAMPALAAQATVYAIDNLGAGLSLAPEGLDCTMRATAERVLQFAEAMGFDEFDLLGTSHGGAVAMFAASISSERRRPRIRRLILVAPVNPWSPHGKRLVPFLVSPLGAFVFRQTIERWRALDCLWLRRLFGDGARIPPDSLNGYRIPVLQNHGFRHASNILKSWIADLADLESVLPKIRDFPTLLMWGTRDRAVHFSSAEPLRRNFRDVRLVAFEGAGHLPYEECPDDFNRALIEFISTAD